MPADATPASGRGAGAARTPPDDATRNGFDVTDAVLNVRSSIRRLSEHHVIPAEVCDGEDPVRSTLHGRHTDITLLVPPPARRAMRNGFDVTDAVFNVRSSIRRLSEHHMIPAEVCDGQDPVSSK